MDKLLEEIESFKVTGIVADKICHLAENKKAKENIAYNLRYKIYGHGYSRFIINPQLSLLKDRLFIRDKDTSVLVDVKDIEAIHIRYIWIGRHRMERYWINPIKSEGK